MPTYEFQCRKCGEHFTRARAHLRSRQVETACPKCKSSDVERVLSGFYARTPRKS